MQNVGLTFTIDHSRIAAIMQAIRTGTPFSIDPENDLANLLCVATGCFWQDSGTKLDLSQSQPPAEVQELFDHWQIENKDPPHVRHMSAADRGAVSELLQLVGWRAKLIAEIEDLQAEIASLGRARESMAQICLARPDEIVPELDRPLTARQHLQRIEEAIEVAQGALKLHDRFANEHLAVAIEHKAKGLFQQQGVRVSRAAGGFAVSPLG